MIIAISAWIAASILSVVLLKWFMTRTRIAAVAIILVLVWQFIPRPLMFFTGLDQPYPNYLFKKDIWELVSISLIIFIIWITIFFASYFLFIQRPLPIGRLLPKVQKENIGIILLIIAFITTLIGVFSTGLLILNVGSIGSFMYQVKVGKVFAGYYVVREISVSGAIFSGIALLYFEKKYRLSEKKKRSRIVIWLTIILFTTNLAFNYFWGNRFNIAMLFGALGIGWHFYINRISFIKAILILFIAASILQSLKILRTENFGDVLFKDIKSTQPFWTDISSSLHMSQFDSFMLAFRDAGRVFPYRDGKDFVNGLLAFIPRTIYPDKETFHVGGWFRRVYEPERINGWPITTIGDWYINFGYWGLLFGSLLSAFVASIFDSRYQDIKKSYWQAGVGPPIAFLIFDGGVDPGFIQSIVLVVFPIYVLAIILNHFGKRKDHKAFG
ncbi:MAG: oligosaccharide repeat unit polymerase [Candidatus Thiodiazotropha sp. (ex Lucinoma borealis)]|nr:oligosaccharide repeat unit polymerase [Candidatus Thiodiazotropha sp. (ex Lucinoma borealis)]